MLLLLPIDQLIKPLSKAQVKDAVYRLMTAMGLPVTSWQEGAVARTIIAVLATIFAGFTQIIALAIRANFLDTAEGIWLTLLAFYVYGVRRIEATFATGLYTLSNSGGGVYSDVQPGDFLAKNPATNKVYTNTEAFTLLPGQTVTFGIRAIEQGSRGTSAPNAISELVTTMLGVTGKNNAPVLGIDEEKDPALRQRCRDSLGSLSPNGPEAAYIYWAKTATRADGSSIGVNRVWVSKSSSIGQVIVRVALPSGAVPGNANDPATDLGAVNKTIQDRVVKFLAPFGVTCIVESAVTITVPTTWDVYIDAAASMTSIEIMTSVDTQIGSLFSNVPIGGYVIAPTSGRVYRNAAIGRVENLYPQIIKADLLIPASDVALAENEVPIQGTTIINVHQVTL